MKRDCCPACGSHMLRTRKLDYSGDPRFWDECQNMACRESSWDCAISKADWKRAESRRRVRLQDAVIRQMLATPARRMEFVTAVRAESDRMLAEDGWDVETSF